MNQDSEQKMQHFHGLHSERQYTTHSITSKSPSRIKSLSQDTGIQLHFSIDHTVRTLLIQFKAALKKVDYKCFYMSEKQLFFIRLSLMDRFRKLFSCKHPPKFILTINTHEFLSLRTVNIKPLKSESKHSFKQSRPNELYDELYKISKMLQGLVQLKNVEINQTDQLDSQYKQDFYSLDATSYYMYSRMLVDSNYSMGQKILTLTDKFSQKQKLQSTSKEDLAWLSLALNQISDDLLQGFNCSRKELVQILSYCRKSVEQYFYNCHQQIVANQQRSKIIGSYQFDQQRRELQKTIDDTYKQLRKFQKSFTSMDIIKQLYMIGLIFKVECEVKQLDVQKINRCLYLIKTCYSSVIGDKIKILKSSGYSQEDYLDYISKFQLDHQITF